MFALIKLSIFFVLSFMILSFPIGKKPLFYHMHKASGHLTAPLLSNASQAFDKGFIKSKKIFKKLFSNAAPEKIHTQKKVQKKEIEHDKDLYTEQERELLKEVLANQ